MTDSPTTNNPTTTNVTTDDKGATRSSHWFSMACFTTIALVGLTTEMMGKLKDQTKEVKFAVSAMICAVSFSGLAVLANMLLRNKFVGTAMEGGMAILGFGISAAGLSVIMKPQNEIAVYPNGVISNANLYFFGWLGFIMSLLVLMGFLKDVHRLGTRATMDDFAFSGWAALCMTSFVVMSSASRIYDNKCNNIGDSDYCRRTSFAFLLGAISGIMALIWTFMGSRLPAMIDTVLSILMLAAWTVGISFFTFGGMKAPAKNIGTLYFFAWGCFAISCSMAMKSLQKMINGRGRSGSVETVVVEEMPVTHKEVEQGEGEHVTEKEPHDPEQEA